MCENEKEKDTLHDISHSNPVTAGSQKVTQRQLKSGTGKNFGRRSTFSKWSTSEQVSHSLTLSLSLSLHLVDNIRSFLRQPQPSAVSMCLVLYYQPFLRETCFKKDALVLVNKSWSPSAVTVIASPLPFCFRHLHPAPPTQQGPTGEIHQPIQRDGSVQ